MLGVGLLSKVIQDIHINWQLETPVYLEPLNWYEWQYQDHLASIEDVLRHALMQTLPRSMGWDLVQIPLEKQQLFVQAAKIYKRGVKICGGTQISSCRQRGSYSIRFWDAESPSELFDESEFLIVDPEVAKYWPIVLSRANYIFESVSEGNKSLDQVLRLIDSVGVSRSWCVVGGGILTDLVGFAAAMVGARIRFVPTTLLAMVDACVGGKTGVNVFPYGKNLLGSFYFPCSVEIWGGWLETLPKRELASGGSECLKHALLTQNRELLSQTAARLSSSDIQGLMEILPSLIRVKAELILRDPIESGERAYLNLGHTLAHALEAYAQNDSVNPCEILHGEAVGIGLLYSLIISRNLGLLEKPEFNDLVDQISSSKCLQLPEFIFHLNFEELIQYLHHDKKQIAIQSKEITFVLLSAQGRAVLHPVGIATLEKSWGELLQLIPIKLNKWGCCCFFSSRLNSKLFP